MDLARDIKGKKVDYIARNQSKCTTRELIKKCQMDLARDIKGKK